MATPGYVWIEEEFFRYIDASSQERIYAGGASCSVDCAGHDSAEDVSVNVSYNAAEDAVVDVGDNGTYKSGDDSPVDAIDDAGANAVADQPVDTTNQSPYNFGEDTIYYAIDNSAADDPHNTGALIGDDITVDVVDDVIVDGTHDVTYQGAYYPGADNPDDVGVNAAANSGAYTGECTSDNSGYNLSEDATADGPHYAGDNYGDNNPYNTEVLEAV